MQIPSLHTINKNNYSSFLPSEPIPAMIYWFRVTNDSNTYAQTSRTHHHTFFEWHFINRGYITYRIGERMLRVNEGEMILIQPGRTHAVVSAEESFSKISLAFSVEEGTVLYDSLLAKSECISPIDEAVLACIHFVITEGERHSYYSKTLANARLLETICLLADLPSYRAPRTEAELGHDERLFKAKQYIDDNTDTFLTCAEVAAYCHISEKQLKRIFLKHEGCTLLAYIHQKKREKAEQMVGHSDLTLQEISEQLGFSSVAYFHRFFIEHIGMTPGDYRRARRA